MTTSNTAAEITALSHRVDVLESREEIRRLRARYHDMVNTDRWSEIGDLFATDAELDYSYVGSASGRAEISEFFIALPQQLSAGGEAFVRQFVTAHDVEVDGDTATGISHLLATPVYHGRSYLVSGRFTDRYARIDGRWLFTSVAIEIWYSVPLEQGWAGSERHHIRT
ncbi:nuclear transport factor 2 family protein [Rhodococcus sp. WS4]|nr:nuclear transport factor 2 family protein [Rhodococcus sp. WS4]